MSYFPESPNNSRGSHHEPEYESAPATPRHHREPAYESTAGSPRYRRGSHHEPEYESAPGTPRHHRGSHRESHCEPGYESTAGSPRYRCRSHRHHRESHRELGYEPTAGSPRYRRGPHPDYTPLPPLSEEERESMFAKDLISGFPHNHLLWTEELILERENQIKMMIAQNYAEKCQKFVFDQLMELRERAKGVSCYAWGPEMESQIETIIRIVPYVERARKQAEFRFSQVHDQGINSVIVRDRQYSRSLLINSDCVELEGGVAAAKTWRMS
ncbi:hypothetical protein Q9L58_008860 [Maublancomyces gigas]|uniref:Uncharacterized protein n=1 Tax=Discina gigas TaxID=1032678 RepID=A0ABR3G9K3_9PEZI